MTHAPRRFLLAVALATVAAPAGADEPVPETLVCLGNEPSWSLRFEAGGATYVTPESPGGQPVRGKLARADWARPPLLAFRGSAAGEGVLVAMVSREACADTMADVAYEFRARLSMPDGSIRLGCCRAAGAAPVPASRATPAAPDVPAPQPAPAPPPGPAPAAPVRPDPAAPPAREEGGAGVTGLALSDGVVCRFAGRGATLALDGRRLNFSCPATAGGPRYALLGPIEAGGGGLRIVRGVLRVDGDRLTLTDPQAVAVTVAEITLADGRVCRSTARAETRAFEGRKVAFTCGSEGLEERVLLGDATRFSGTDLVLDTATIGSGELGFVVRGREPLLVSAPR
jgi:uncharacterized membrane protein